MNNLVKIDSFLDDKENTIAILPKVSVEVVIFYHLLIEKLSKKKIFLFRKVDDIKNIDELIAPSLFDEKKSYIIDVGPTKNIIDDLSRVSDKSQKFFLFLNYASYKKNAFKLVQLNAYDYKNDMSSFVKQDQDFQTLDNKQKTEFLNFSYNNPHLFFSEFQKSKLQKLILDKTIAHESETIISVRNAIFKYKNEFSIKILPKLYNLFKKEVKIKKFNF